MKNPYINNNEQGNQKTSLPVLDDLLPKNFDSMNFLKGVLIGAGVGYILTNEKAQQKIFKAIAKAGLCDYSQNTT